MTEPDLTFGFLSHSISLFCQDGDTPPPQKKDRVSCTLHLFLLFHSPSSEYGEKELTIGSPSFHGSGETPQKWFCVFLVLLLFCRAAFSREEFKDVEIDMGCLGGSVG